MARTLPPGANRERILELASLAVAGREDAGCEDVLRALSALQARVSFLDMPVSDVSSSMVRERVAEGQVRRTS